MWTAAFPNMVYSLQHGHNIRIILLIHRHSSLRSFWGQFSVFNHYLACSILHSLHYVRCQGNCYCKRNTCVAGEDCCITKLQQSLLRAVLWAEATAWTMLQENLFSCWRLLFWHPLLHKRKECFDGSTEEWDPEKNVPLFYFNAEVRDVDGKCCELTSSPIQLYATET